MANDPAVSIVSNYSDTVNNNTKFSAEISLDRQATAAVLSDPEPSN